MGLEGLRDGDLDLLDASVASGAAATVALGEGGDGQFGFDGGGGVVALVASGIALVTDWGKNDGQS